LFESSTRRTSLFPFLPSDHLICLDILLLSSHGNVFRHLHTLPTKPSCGQPVPQVLLVIAILGPSLLVGRFEPETRRVGSKNLVDEYDFVSFCVETELELGVGNYDTTAEGKLPGLY